MIKTLVIIFGLIIFFLVLALIGQLDDLCETEKEIEILQNDLDRANSKLKESIEIRLKVIEYIKKLDFDDINELARVEILEILKGVDKEWK